MSHLPAKKLSILFEKEPKLSRQTLVYVVWGVYCTSSVGSSMILSNFEFDHIVASPWQLFARVVHTCACHILQDRLVKYTVKNK